MDRLIKLLFAAVISVTLLMGCASSGRFQSVNMTNVELSEPNYRIVATNISGEASAGYLIGLSVASGGEMQTGALLRVKGEGLLYKEALEDLWKNFEAAHGSVAGRHLALINVRYDADAMNVLGLYTQPKISIRADVIEFGTEREEK